MSPATRTRVGATALHIKASLEEVWEVLTDAKSWQTWWPDGAPTESNRPWALGDELVWDGRESPELERARITELERPGTDHLSDSATVVGAW